MWLAYGQNEHDEFIHVSEVTRGKSALACPYCGGLLTAKKGRVKAHHFAHTGATCKTSNTYDFYDITKDEFPLDLGLYDYAMQRRQEFENEQARLCADLQTLTADLHRRDQYLNAGIALLETVSQPYKDGTRPKSRQKNFEVLQQLRRFLAGEKLHDGIECMTPRRHTMLPDFAQVRHGAFKKYLLLNQPQNRIGVLFPISRHSLIWPREIWQLERNLPGTPCIIPDDLFWAFKVLPDYLQQKSAFNQVRADLTAFEREHARFQRFTLYFLAIQRRGATYHKIGITGRTVAARLKEIEQEARKLGDVTLTIRNQIKGYAFLETFFKRKYADYHIDFGAHTEYFGLPEDVLKEIDADLSRLEFFSLDRVGKIKAGMQAAKAAGKQIGRPAREEQAAAFLRKPKSQEIAALLKQGLGIREIQRQTGYSINTIRKVNNFVNFG